MHTDKVQERREIDALRILAGVQLAWAVEEPLQVFPIRLSLPAITLSAALIVSWRSWLIRSQASCCPRGAIGPAKPARRPPPDPALRPLPTP